jgi:hypothetical protein
VVSTQSTTRVPERGFFFFFFFLATKNNLFPVKDGQQKNVSNLI